MRELPKLAGVAGWPIAHTLSPLIHTIWAARADVDGYYIPIEVSKSYDDFTRTMESLRVIGFAGVNVTLPHKNHALRYAAAASDIAVSAGAANMLTFSVDGAYADNSDVHGFQSALAEKLSPTDSYAQAVVLGAGGAARGVVLALQNTGVKNIIVANRTLEHAQAIAADHTNVETAPWSERRDITDSADIIVNTTSLGMTGQPPLEIDLNKVGGKVIVADMVYSPLETPLLRQALQSGLCSVDGLSVLMHQAAPGFRQWFGGDPWVDSALRGELEAELDRRRRG